MSQDVSETTNQVQNRQKIDEPPDMEAAKTLQNQSKDPKYMDTQGMGKPDKHEKILVTIVTPSGFYPEDEPLKINDDKEVSEILEKAAKHLKLTDTSDWVAYVDGIQINPALSFKANGLEGTVDIEWHKPEGGGGASFIG